VKIFTVTADVEVVVYFLLQLTPHCLTKPMLVNIENKHRLFLFDTCRWTLTNKVIGRRVAVPNDHS
jgi:hypothetical protein